MHCRLDRDGHLFSTDLSTHVPKEFRNPSFLPEYFSR